MDSLRCDIITILNEKYKGKVPVCAMKAYGESRSITPLILKLLNGCMSVVNFMPRPLHCQ